MQKLVKGLHHFQSTIFSSQEHLFKRLAKGQHPLALFITCSDSRIDPNLMMQAEPGELFIMRNAGISSRLTVRLMAAKRQPLNMPSVCSRSMTLLFADTRIAVRCKGCFTRNRLENCRP
jgi:hypothetical protein